MKRLLDMPAISPALEHAQRLIEAAPSVDDSNEQMLRIRRALDQPALATRGAILRAPAFALGGALVVFGASAFAAVRVWVEHRAPHEVRESTEAHESTEVREAKQQRAENPADAPNAPLLAAAPSAPQPPAVESEIARASAERTVVASAGEPVAQATQRDSSRVSARARVKSAHKAARVRRAKLKQARRSAAASRVAPEATEALPVEQAHVPGPAPVVEPAPEHADSIAAAPVPARVQAEPERVERLRLQVAEFLEPRDRREETGVGVSEPEVSAAAKRSSDSELVVRAVRALRRDRDPDAASRLLERYLSRNPRGVLAEEVLSLQIEAALAAKDSRATSYAREYMSRYPEGRYRARAQSALSGRVP